MTGVPPLDDPAPPLAGRVRQALGWSFLNNVVGRFGTTLTGIVLARILVPEDYGIYAVALVGLNALLSMNELGVSLAVVRWPGDVRRIAPTVATLAMIFSAALFVVCFAVTPTVCRALNAPEATSVLRLLSVGVLIDAATAVPAAFMTREFLQKRRLVIDTLSFAVNAGASIALALDGHGAWSLAWGALLGNLVSALLIIAWSPQRVRPGFRPDVVRELLDFGLPLALASLLLFGMLNVDYIVIGATLGPVELGFYLLAFNLASWPVNMFSAPVRRVSLPAFSRLSETGAGAGESFVRAFALLLAAALPACMLLSVFALPLVGFVYGDKWLDAAAALPFLTVLALGRVLVELAYDFLVAIGWSKPNLAIQVLWLAVLVPALVMGARMGGIAGVAGGHAVVVLAVVLPAYAVVLHRAGVPIRSLIRQALRPALATVLAGSVGILAMLKVPGTLTVLPIGGTAALLVYLGVVYPMRRLVHSPAAPAMSDAP